VPRALAAEIQKAHIPGVSEAEPFVLGRITLPQLDKNGRSVWLFGLDWSKQIRAAHEAQRSKRLDAPLTPLRFVRGSDGVEIHWIHDPTAASGASRIALDRLSAILTYFGLSYGNNGVSRIIWDRLCGRIPVLAGDRLALALAAKRTSEDTTFLSI